MAKSKRRREQAAKNPIDDRIRAEIDRARSNAAGPHKSGAEYQRKPKHFKGWD